MQWCDGWKARKMPVENSMSLMFSSFLFRAFAGRLLVGQPVVSVDAAGLLLSRTQSGTV